MPHAAPERIEVEPDEVRDPFSKAVAIAIVVATLAGALVGYLESRASRSAALANVDAQRSMLRAMTGLARSNSRASVDFQTFALAELDRHQSAELLQRTFLPGAEERRLELERQVRDAVAERTLEITALQPGGPESPANDPVFPLRYFADAQHEADRLWALANAANEEDAAWEGREATFTAILTMLAVAVYLLGLSLTLRERIRLLLAGLGGVLIVVGGVWAATLIMDSPERAPDEAAAAFADGRRAFFLATTPDEFGRAAEHFSRAIDLRPTFARAYADRAAAVFQTGSPQTAVFTSLSAPEITARATRDLATAVELGLRTRATLGSLAFDTFLLGIDRGRPDLLEESVTLTREAVALAPTDPILRYNLGVALLALDDAEGAQDAYEQGTLHVLYRDVERRVPRDNPFLQQQWVSGALTDLEILAERREDLADEIRATKELVVGSVAEGRLLSDPGSGGGERTDAPPPPAEPVEVAVDLFPGELQWRGNLPGFDPDRDTVSTHWYHRTPLGWTVVPEVSGVHAVFVGEEELSDLQSYLSFSFPPRCIPEGRYRVELYAEGRLVGVGTGETQFSGLEAQVLRDLNMALCHPGWELSEQQVPGFLQGVVSPDGSEGAYFFRFQHPSQLIEGPPGRSAGAFLDLGVETFEDLFPSPPRFDQVADDDYFLGLDGTAKHWYSYRGGQVLAGAGLADDGSLLMGVVFGPDEGWEGELLRVFDSMIRYSAAIA